MTVEAPQVPAYRPFTVQVSRLRRLSPSFLRVTFTGAELDAFTSNGLDQRIKVLLPLPGRGLLDRPSEADWYGEWRALPPERQLPMRTYTVRALRPEAGEVDVDFVLHGATGPASAWAERAAVGDEVVLIGPNARFSGPTGGFEWRPPADACCLLVAGDETAVPAVCAIVESLPAGCDARVVLEVPTRDDALDLAAPAGVAVTWLPRRPADGSPAARGALLTAAVVAAVETLPRPPSGLYAWLAGEAGVVTSLRRHLVQERGVDRRAVAFMGYWREGRESD
jgi:NADPH-dependent ferric siderophore reductase